MKRKFYLLFTALLMMAATSAWADTNYGIGDRILGISNVVPNDYVVIEAISSTNNRGYYITETDGKYTWKNGFEQASVWKLVPYSNSRNAYYLQNAETSHYMGGTRDNPTTVSSLNDAVAISVYDSTSLQWSWETYADGSSGWDKNSFVLRVNNDLCLGNDVANKESGSFANGGYLHNIQWNMYKAVDLSALKYKIGKRVTQLSDLYNGELVYIQAASSSLYYDSFIQETSDGQYRWDKGLNKNCVWKLISTGTSNQYYFQNVVSGKYMAGTNTVPTLSETVADNCKIDVYDHWTYGYHSYDVGEKPRGWDMYFFELQHHNDWWLANDGNDHLNDRLFPNGGGIHNIQWNFYEAVIDDGTGETLNPGAAISEISEIKTNRAYTLTTTGKGAMEVDVNNEKGMRTNCDYNSWSSGYTQGSLKIGFNQWVFRPAGNNNAYYLYNIAAKKYIKSDGSDGNELTTDAPDVFTIVKDGNYFKIKAQSSEKDFGFKGTDNNKLYISSNLTDNSGTQLVIAEAAIFDPSVFKSTTVPSFTLADKVDYTPPTYSFTATSATYTRNMTEGVKWGTIMLPYDVDANDDVAFYSIDSESGGVLTVTKADKLTAGTPALFKTNGASSVTFSASSATVKPTTQTASGGDLTLVGTYTRDTIDVEGTYYIKDDKFYSKGDGISFIVNPFRAYIKSDGSTNSNAFSIAVDDDPTGITAAATSTGASDEIEGVYSISGVKLSDLQKGINIIRYRSGKTQKVILK